MTLDVASELSSAAIDDIAAAKIAAMIARRDQAAAAS